MSELPEGWELVPLLEYVKFLPTGVEKYSGKIEYYSTGSIQDNIHTPEGSFTYEERPSRANRLARLNDVFQARMKETNKGLLITDALANTLFSTGFIQLRPYNNTYDNKLLFYYVRSKLFLDQRDELATGSTQEALTDTKAIDILILFPPLAEQRRIVAKLEMLLGKVDACQKRLAKIPMILKRFRQSILAAACSGRLTTNWRENNLDAISISPSQRLREIGQRRQQAFQLELSKAAAKGENKPRRPSNLDPNAKDNPAGADLPESWYWTSFEDAASTVPHSMSSGPFGSALGRKDYLKTGVPVIRGQNIQSGRFVVGNFVFISEDKAKELKRSSAQPGDIVIVAVGSSGQSAIIPDEIQFAILSQNCNKFTFDAEMVMPEFVNFVLQIEMAIEQLRDRTTDTARPFLSLTNLKTLLLPIPPLPEQKEIVRRVEALFALADQIEACYTKGKAYVDKLTQSILAKAFRGELVPQDPNDEPASVLLERIKAEQVKQRIKKKSKRNNS